MLVESKVIRLIVYLIWLEYLSKMVHLRVMEYFRIKSKSEMVVGGNSGIENQGDLKNMTFG